MHRHTHTLLCSLGCTRLVWVQGSTHRKRMRAWVMCALMVVLKDFFWGCVSSAVLLLESCLRLKPSVVLCSQLALLSNSHPEIRFSSFTWSASKLSWKSLLTSQSVRIPKWLASNEHFIALAQLPAGNKELPMYCLCFQAPVVIVCLLSPFMTHRFFLLESKDVVRWNNL